MVGRRSRPDPVVSEYVQQRLAALLAETPARRAAPEEAGASRAPGDWESPADRSRSDSSGWEPLEELPGPEPSSAEPPRFDTARTEGAGRAEGAEPARAELEPAGEPGATGRAAEVPPSPAPMRLPFTRRHVVVVALVVVLAAVVGGVALLRARPVAIATPTTTTSAAPTPVEADPTAAGSASAEPPPLLVHVLGEVREPGVVELAAGARVRDALGAAGGLTKAAVPGDLNLAQPLVDGQQVVVSDDADDSGVRDSTGGSTDNGTDSTGGDTGGTSGDQLDLNAATEPQLLELPGVGPVTAGSIIAWREANGQFTRVEELQEIDGIGPKTFARLAPLVRV